MNTSIISQDCSAEIENLTIFQKMFYSFDDIAKNAALNDGFSSCFLQNKKAKDFFLSPVKTKEPKKIVLYWEGPSQSIPGMSSTYSYFFSKGYEFITENIHPSILVNSMARLTEGKLNKLGIPDNVDILLPMPSLIFTEDGDPCFLIIYRSFGLRRMGIVNLSTTKVFAGNIAFLLQKIV